MRRMRMKKGEGKGGKMGVKGGVYEEDLGFGEEVGGEMREGRGEDRGRKERRVREVREKYEGGIEGKGGENKGGYKGGGVRDEEGSIEGVCVEVGRYMGGRVDSDRRGVDRDMEGEEGGGGVERGERGRRGEGRGVGKEEERFESGKLGSGEEERKGGMGREGEGNGGGVRGIREE